MRIFSFGEVLWDVAEHERTLGGAPLNFAAHAALQGCEAYLVSAVGDDALGREAFMRVSELGVKTEHVSVSDALPTGQCIVSTDEKGVPSYCLLAPVAYDRISPPTIKEQTEDDVLAFGTLSLRESYNRDALTHLLSSHRFSEVYVDLNIRPPFYGKESISFCLSAATLLKVSEEELPLVSMSLFGEVLGTDGCVDAIRAAYPNVKLILLTAGEKGAVCYDVTEGKTYRVPASPAEVISTVGAGDSYGATFLAQWKKTHDVFYAMTLASRVSAFVVSHRDSVPEGMVAFLSTL